MLGKEYSSIDKKVRDLDSREMYSVLISTTKGKPYRSNNKAYDHLVEEFNKALRFKYKEEVEWFFTNTSRAIRDGFSGFSVKLSSSYWTGNECNISYRGVRKILEYMVDNNYIYMLRGSYDYRDPEKSYASIVRFNGKLLALLDKNDLELYVPSTAIDYPIVLKDRRTKEVLVLEKTEEIEKMAKEMDRYNQSISQVTVAFDGVVVPLLEYQRKFNGDFKSGGRLFAHGGSIQLVPQELRLSHITINGEHVQEWDYSANHPRILLEVLNKTVDNLDVDPVSFDPYSASPKAIVVDQIAVEEHKIKYNLDKYNPVRTLMKHAVMRALNCDDFDKAWSSLSHEVYLDSKKDTAKRQFIGLVKPDCQLVMNAVCEHNQVIVKDFFKDKGIYLQHLDSQIALRVIDLMLQSGEVVLCWHDSFQCRESVGYLLESAMRVAWRDVLGNNLFCKIEKK